MICRQKNNYDNVAGFYDQLARLIFGNALSESQFSLLPNHFPGTRVVIVGGGTGEILKELARIKTAPLTITFIELSEKMLQKARKKDTGCHKVTFICGDAGRFKSDEPFNVVITPFLFDNFTSDKATAVFENLNNLLCPGGIWLFTDFNVNRLSPWWQKLLLKSMYRFFKILAHVEAKQLPDTQRLFLAAGYTCEQQLSFYRNFILSEVQRKPS